MFFTNTSAIYFHFIVSVLNLSLYVYKDAVY